MEHNRKSWISKEMQQCETRYMQEIQKKHPLPTPSSRKGCMKIMEIITTKTDELKQQNIKLEKQIAKSEQRLTNFERITKSFKNK